MGLVIGVLNLVNGTHDAEFLVMILPGISLFFSCVHYGKNTRLPVDFNMMPKKVSGIEGSDRDDASEVTDVANGNDEVKRMRTKMMVKRLIMKTKMMVKRWVKRMQCLQVC